MTDYELISSILSGLAVLVALFSLFVSLRNPQLQAFKNRARLRIEETVIEYTAGVRGPNSEAVAYLPATCVGIGIFNDGPLPAKEVQIVCVFTTLEGDEIPTPEFYFDPPVDTEIRSSSSKIDIKLTKPIPPDSGVAFVPNVWPDEVWIYNEFGESHSLRFGEGLTNRKTPQRFIGCPVEVIIPGE